ncbi:MAG: signal peptidase I [Candidatus Pacearchaeota archaeon]
MTKMISAIKLIRPVRLRPIRYILTILLFSLILYLMLELNLDPESQKPYFLAKNLAKNNDILSPGDHINESSILVYPDKVVLLIPNSYLARFAATKSMDPVLDVEANAIEIKPSNETEISPGDIISYRSSLSKELIIHRVIEVGYDEKGWYAIAKGDNNPTHDPEKIRFEQVNGLVVALIY